MENVSEWAGNPLEVDYPVEYEYILQLYLLIKNITNVQKPVHTYFVLEE